MTSIQTNFMYNSCIQNQSMQYQHQFMMQPHQMQYDSLSQEYNASAVRATLKHIQPKKSSAIDQPRQHIGYQPYDHAESASVARRNARERNRVKQVNDGYANLRQHIPQSIVNSLTKGGRGASKKLSKVDTLKLALEYIYRLQDVLDESDSDSTNSIDSLSEAYSPVCSSASQDYAPFSRSAASLSPNSTYDSSSVSLNEFDFVQYGQQCDQQAEEIDQQQNTSPEDDELLDCIAWWQQE